MATLSVGGGPILALNRPLRLFTIFILYVAQGVPIGLFWFAIPTWMAANGASAADVGYVLGFTSLPWTLKLVNGFIMDRYAFLAMGRRRPWIAGAQLVMIGLLVSAAIMQPGVTDVGILAAAGFMVNMATTFQDVGVDGMAVDIMEEDERAKASGMMFGGQAIGMAASTALTGTAIARFGTSAAYLLSACFIGAITIYLLALREREGERLLPWSEGRPHERNLQIHLGAWVPIIRTTFRSFFANRSLLFMPVLLGVGFHYGVFTGGTPLIGTGSVGWDEERISTLVGSAQLAAGIAGMTIGGWGGDWLGAKKSLIAVFTALLVLSAWMWSGADDWDDVTRFTTFVYAWLCLDTLVRVSFIPIAMRLCDPGVAATQFTLYMACSNFATTLGAWVLASSAALGGLPPTFLIVMAVHLIALITMLLVAFPRSAKVQARIGAKLPHGEGLNPRID